MLSRSRNSNSCESVAVVGGYYWGPVPKTLGDSPAKLPSIEEVLGQNVLRRLDPLSQYALYAVEMARADAGLGVEVAAATNVLVEGVCFGTAFGAQATRIRFARRLVQQGLASTNPIDFPDSIDSAPAAHVAIRWGLRGPSLTFVDGTASAANALVVACRQVASGRAERMYVVAGDVFDPFIGQSITDSLKLGTSYSSEEMLEHSSAAGYPSDAILALLLERNTRSDREPLIVVDGFLPLLGDRARPGTATLMRDVTTPIAAGDLIDPSGVATVAGAWLGVKAKLASHNALSQQNAMDDAECRMNLRCARFPDLAFVGRAR